MGPFAESRDQWPGQQSPYAFAAQPRYSEFEQAAREYEQFLAFVDRAPELDAELAQRFSLPNLLIRQVVDNGAKQKQRAAFDVRRFDRLTTNRPFFEFLRVPESHWSRASLPSELTKRQMLMWFRRPKRFTEQYRDIVFPLELGDQIHLFGRNTFEPRFVVRLFALQQRPGAATGQAVFDIVETFDY